MCIPQNYSYFRNWVLPLSPFGGVWWVHLLRGFFHQLRVAELAGRPRNGLDTGNKNRSQFPWVFPYAKQRGLKLLLKNLNDPRSRTYKFHCILLRKKLHKSDFFFFCFSSIDFRQLISAFNLPTFVSFGSLF